MTSESSESVNVGAESQHLPPPLSVRVAPLRDLPFSQLLQWTQSLRNRHCRPQPSLGKQLRINSLKSDNEESVSLQSLVSIHNSVIQAVLESSSVARTALERPETHDLLFNVDSESLGTNLSDVWTLLLRTQEDENIARRLWAQPVDPIDSTDDLDAQRLLMVQYGAICIRPVVSSYMDKAIFNRYDQFGLSHCLALLRILVLPLCLSQPTGGAAPLSVNDEANITSSAFHSASFITDDLLSAMLDAIFSNSESDPSRRFLDNEAEKHDILLQQQWLMSCLDLIVSTVRLHFSSEHRKIKKSLFREEHCWTFSCRIVRRLATEMKLSPNTNGLGSVGTLCTIAVDFVASFCRDGVNESNPDRNPFREYDDEPSLLLSRVLRPMVMDLLPVLTDALDNDASSDQYTAALSEFRRLWVVLWNHYNVDVSRQYRGSAIKDPSCSHLEEPWHSSTSPISCVTTSVLCVILPSLVHTALPVAMSPPITIEDELKIQPTSLIADCIPIFQQNMWEMILRCLRLGLSYHVDHRGRRRGAMSRPSRLVAFSPDTIRMHQLHRRRGLFLLRLLVENFDPIADSVLSSEYHGKANVQKQKGEGVLWRKYVACFETLEMETDQHLIDQVWETVTELFDQMVPSTVQNTEQSYTSCTFPESSTSALPLLTWDWMQLMLGRVLVSHESPVLRKLSLFRLFKGQAGIRCGGTADFVVKDMASTAGEQSLTSSKGKAQRKAKSKARGASLHVISVDFLFTVVLYSFDTLLSSVGTNMQATAAILSHSGSGGSKSQVAVSEEMVPLLCMFFSQYLRLLLFDADKASSHDRKFLVSVKLEQFFRRLWSSDVLDGVHHKITVSIFESVSSTLQDFDGEYRQLVPLYNDMLTLVSESFQLAFSDGSMVTSYKDSLLRSLTAILRYSTVVGNRNPQSILSVLALYPSRMLDQSFAAESVVRDGTSLLDATSNPMLKWLSIWLVDEVSASSKTRISVGATVATAFVDGVMSGRLNKESLWDPKSGCSNVERKLAKAIALLCILPNSFEGPSSAGELLWPAIHKGVSHASVVIFGSNLSKANQVSRALLLLEYGVRFYALSGLGNGDLVVDQKTQNMLPPLQKIDTLLGNCVNFILFHVKSLFTATNGMSAVDCLLENSGNASRSSDARVLSMTFARLVCQLQYLVNGFPSSQTIGPILASSLKESLDIICHADSSRDGENICLHVALAYVNLAGGCEMNGGINLSNAKSLLHLQFDDDRSISGTGQALRSVFHFAKWGAVSKVLPIILSSKSSDSSCNDINAFIDDLIDSAIDAVEASPSTALVPLFDSIISVTNFRFVESTENQKENLSNDSVQFSKIIQTLLDLADVCDSNADSIYMIDKICAVLFQSTLLLHEYQKLQDYPSYEAPIRDAFRRLVRMSGTERPHLSRIVLSRACTGWLKCSDVGIPGIPYRDDIVQLLVHKEDVVPVTSLFTSDSKSPYNDRISMVPNTDETCISRGFLLAFFSKFPDVGVSLSSTVLKDLLHYIILKLVGLVTLAPTSSSGLIMYGTPEYCVKIRALQALCVLCRFITAEIANAVCTGVFEAMGKQTSHNQIRYFLEVLTLQLARMHATIFVKALIQQIRRTDLSLQMVASLMIISGNLIVGRYKEDFFRQCDVEDVKSTAAAPIDLHAILAGVIPWLSSTQGFSRAIAQLLTYKLIPLVVDNPLADSSSKDSDWYLRSVYRFLDENPEMRRLRRKQEHFFEGYEVDSVCTPEGVFAIPVDESHEANPVHMIDVIKECLQEVYDEGNMDRAPLWKQMEIETKGSNVEDTLPQMAQEVVNFQRKIIPVDELNLALENLNEQKHRNLAGRRKQKLIVCASLIDKVPNLGGLARTCEIFALDRLVVPDLQITKMDNFKNLCVGAGDWIEIEECSEANLLPWLRQKSSDGYHIVGLEQTSSSASLLDYIFPDSASQRGTVLLLGKEKEGIPVEYIDVVDQCIEIPQYGIIRSLNVHVSGAIAIWEYTKQFQKQQ